jgi:hypothetical protein
MYRFSRLLQQVPVEVVVEPLLVRGEHPSEIGPDEPRPRESSALSSSVSRTSR